jgi:TPR repeat protein
MPSLQDGYGVDINLRLSTALFKEASDLGDPEAQGQMGLRLSLGLQDPHAWSNDGIAEFKEVRDGLLRPCPLWHHNIPPSYVT